MCTETQRTLQSANFPYIWDHRRRFFDLGKFIGDIIVGISSPLFGSPLTIPAAPRAAN